MNYRSLMAAAAAAAALFGTYLLWYGTATLSEYVAVPIREAADPDSHGMSVMVGYTMIRLVGALVLGLALPAWLARGLAEPRARRAVALGLLCPSLLGFAASFIQQGLYWGTAWGRLYVAAFLLLSAIFAGALLTSGPVSPGPGAAPRKD